MKLPHIANLELSLLDVATHEYERVVQRLKAIAADDLVPHSVRQEAQTRHDTLVRHGHGAFEREYMEQQEAALGIFVPCQ
jgi:uncharacterized protein (UPF0147 family)